MAEIFQCGRTWLHVNFAAPGVVHVRICLGGDFPAERSYAVMEEAQHEISCVRWERSGGTVLSDGENEVHIADDLTVTVFDAHERIVHQDVAGKSYCSDALGRSVHCFRIDGYRHVYGLGERTGELNRHERVFRLDMRDAIGYNAEKTDPMYKHIPFIIRRDVEHGLIYGLFYDAPCRGEFDLGCERSGYWPRYCKITLESQQIDYYIILGGSMHEIIRRYTGLTGRTIMPPLAAMGHMASTMYLTETENGSDEAIRHFISQLHARGFGCDGYHLSSGYTSIAGKRYVFNWNHDRFPDPEGFIHSLTDRGLLVSPNIKPAMLTDHPLYDTFAEAGAFLMDSRTGRPYLTRYWGGMASFVDMLSEKGRSMWMCYMKMQLLDKGVNAIWDDNNEYEMDEDFAVTAGDSRRAYAVRPAFSNEMARAACEATEQSHPGLRPYVLTRSGYAGIQRYAQTWAGDNRTEWSALKYNIPIMLGMSLSGVANQGCDIGGFAGPAPEGELFVRWVQNGIFQPRFCLHSCNDDNTITQPWTYEEYTPYVRRAFELRYALAPYLYGLMRQAAVYGDPIMRPMTYAFDDAELADESFDFMLGDGLLIANVVEKGAVTRSVRLPAECDWFDWDTHERFAGGQTVTVDAPLSKIPMFYRAGCLIPLAEPALQVTPKIFSKVKLLCEASAHSEFTLYQDDGVSRAYQTGQYLETKITCQPDEKCIALNFEQNGEYPDGVETYEIRLAGRFAAPLEIRVDEKRIVQRLSVEEFEQDKGDAWYFSLRHRHALIRFANPKRSFHLMVDYRIHDLIGM